MTYTEPAFVAIVALWLAVAGCGLLGDEGAEPCADTEPTHWERREGAWRLPNRVEYHRSDRSVLRAAADSTAVLLDDGALSRTETDEWTLSDDAKSRVCCAKGEVCRPYSGQPAPGYCTGFLVDRTTLVTAAHCLRSVPCESLRAVFGFYYGSPGAGVTPMAEGDVYSCRRVVARESKQNFDFALVRLDRKVTGRDVPALRHDGIAAPEDPVGVVGAPGGIPFKLSRPGRITKTSTDVMFFASGLRLAAGDSGGPVVNLETGEIEGLSAARGRRADEAKVFRVGCFLSDHLEYADPGDCR